MTEFLWTVYGTLQLFQLVNFNYGMKGENPWNHIHFYSKSKPEIAVILPTEQVSV